MLAQAGADGNRLGSVMKAFAVTFAPRFSLRAGLKCMAVGAGAVRRALENRSTPKDRSGIQRCGFAARPADGVGQEARASVFLIPRHPSPSRGRLGLSATAAMNTL